MLSEGLLRNRSIFEMEFWGTNTRSPGRNWETSPKLFSFNIFFKSKTCASTRSVVHAPEQEHLRMFRFVRKTARDLYCLDDARV